MFPLEVTIHSIENTRESQSAIEKFHLDSPQISTSPQDHCLVIAGWVLPKNELQPLEIVVRESGTRLKRARINVPRPDILNSTNTDAQPNDKIGFHFELGTLGLGRSFELEINVTLKNPATDSIQIKNLCLIKVRKHSNLKLSSQFQPIQVTAIGRSGTTLLMQILSLHPEILTTNFYPYELRQAAYWINFLRTATAPADFEHSSHPDKFETVPQFIGHNPYSHPEYINQYKNPQNAKNFYSIDTFNALAKLCSERIDAYYRLVSQEEGKIRAKLFAEKLVPGPVQNICRDIYDNPREIILTRDFRDILCSAKSFNNKRNNQSFGRDKVNDDFEWVERIAMNGAKRLHNAWHERKDSALHVRYEDLITDPLTQISRIFTHLEVNSCLETASTIAKKIFSSQSDIATHSTTSTPQASIGRWQHDMPQELQEHCASKLGYALRTFGYTL
jgi:hypothetical protein